MTNEELLCLSVDVLQPAALEGQITAANASAVEAKTIVEGANGPTTPGADDILAKRGIQVVPDILANAGGVVASYYEWVRDRNGYFWPEATVSQRIEETMVEAFATVASTARRHGVNLRIGAYILAMERIMEARSLRGLYA